LGQFIDTRFPQKVAEFCYSRIVFDCLFIICILVDNHGPKLETLEGFIVLPASQLKEKDRPFRFHFN